MEDIVEKIHALLFTNLVMQSPVLSGNMQSMIQTGLQGSSTREIIIDAPFYDMKKWNEDKIVVHTGQVINGKTAYAQDVNLYGAFFRHNSSEGWVDRAIKEVVEAIANETGAQVVYDIRLQ